MLAFIIGSQTTVFACSSARRKTNGVSLRKSAAIVRVVPPDGLVGPSLA